jgi:hypothetical protein
MADTAEPVDLQAGGPRKRVDGPADRAKAAKESKKKTILPKPKSLRVAADVFFKWAGTFNEEQKGRAVFHVYRDYPVIDLTLIGEQKPKLITQFSGLLPFEVTAWSDYILKHSEWGGSGAYKILCTEIGVPGCISMCKFTLEDGDYPPVVDPKSLVIGHPDNKGYIQGLRARGIRLPGDDPLADRSEIEEEQEMKVAEPLVEHILTENRELREELRGNRDEASVSSGSEETVMAEATSEAVRVVAEGAREAIRMVGTQSTELAKASAPQYNPIELFKAGRESAGDGGMAMLTFFMGAMEKQTSAMQTMHEKTLEYMREKDEKQPISAVTVQAEQKQGIDLLLEEGQKFKQLGDLFGWTTRGRSRDNDEPPAPKAEPKESALDKLIGKLAENPALLVTGIFGITNLAQTFIGRGKPVEEVLKAASTVASSIPGAPQVPAEPDPAIEIERQKLALQNFLRAIEALFLEHFFDPGKKSLTGYTFAEDFLSMSQSPTGQLVFTPEGPMTDLGKQQYQQIKAGGPIQFDRIIRDYQPIWSMVGGNMPKYQEFMKQFFNFFEDSEKAAREREAKLAQVPTSKTPA